MEEFWVLSSIPHGDPHSDDDLQDHCKDNTPFLQAGESGDGAMNDRDEKGDRGDDDGGAILHPLLIEHVVKKILSFFPLSYSNPDILSFRQVCKLWCHTVTNRLRQTKNVRKLHFKYHGDPSGTDHLWKFLMDMRDTQNLPFDAFVFDVHFFLKRNERAFREFLNNFSQCVASLEINIGKQYSLNLLEAVDLNVINFSNVKSLKFHCTHLFTMSDAQFGSTNSPITWEPRDPRELAQETLILLRGILSTAQNLEEVDLYLPPSYFEGEEGPRASSRVGEILTENLAASVETLKLTLKVDGSHLEALGRRLNLKKLHLDFYGSQLDDNSILELIQSQALTLQDLRLIDFDDNFWREPESRLPELGGNVTTLTVKGYHLSLVTAFPNLQKLKLLTEGKCTTQIVHRNVLELELLYPPESPKFTGELPLRFPNIRSLRIQATPDSVKAIETVFQNFRETLVELEIHFLEAFSKQPVDHIFTGIPLSRCYIIGENGMYGVGDQRRILGEVRRRPCLENLKRLKKLVIGSDAVATILTDVTVHYAFFRCPALEEIKFIGNHSISADCFQSLKARFRVTQERNESRSQYGGHAESLENSRALVLVLR